eukprot:TRINITY_DN109044_c0_g1_i1.p1 TRINITY_DN109044_c0_g1~~TRINITY_DN109044_c0_g1_i1.p1  ORF type:complete len:244 (+),score=35.41 TRINITY_DN109044_c0_g1_i1:19-750(+)
MALSASATLVPTAADDGTADNPRYAAILAPVRQQLTAYVSSDSDKLDRFCAAYSPAICCYDASSNSKLFPDYDAFRLRYETCFQNSPDLDAIITRRFVILAPSAPSDFGYVIDCETFFNLVKPIGGKLDGSTGLSDKIERGSIVVMYEVAGPGSSKTIQNAWFLPDQEGLGKVEKSVGNVGLGRVEEVSEEAVENSVSLKGLLEIIVCRWTSKAQLDSGDGTQKNQVDDLSTRRDLTVLELLS